MITAPSASPVSLQSVLQLLKQPRKASDGAYTACCPAHADSRASLSVSQGRDGKILFHCHAGCEFDSITRALGLEPKQLFPATTMTPPERREVVATYDYTNANGELLYQVVRYSPKDFRVWRPDGHGEKIWNLQDVERVPYRLPELIEGIALDRTIFVVEGEKDADALTKRGLTATTNHGGAGKWRPEHSRYFAGARVVIIADNDQPGKEHAESVRSALASTAASVRILDLPGLPAKGDVSDWLRTGTLDQLISLAENSDHARDISLTSHNSDAENDAELIQIPQLDPAALYGPVGDWVRVVAPETEASSAALLFSALTAVGALIGRNPSVMLDGARHGVNLFLLLVGPTTTGRKGTAIAHVRRLLKTIDPEFVQKNIAGGLSSGEGIIHAIRDAGQPVGDRPADPGVTDKRILVIESEFAGVIKKMSREGNTLSMTIRDGWDGYTLRNMTKGTPETASDPHLGIIGQITAEELKRRLDESELTNGFINRFLMAYTERSKCLPFGGSRDTPEERDACDRLAFSVGSARRVGSVNTFTPSGREWWIAHYTALTTGRPGRVGAATQRGAAQVRRLALLFTVLDGEHAVGTQHLEAAFACWRYSEESAAYIFGHSDISEKARKLNDALLSAGTEGMDRMAIRKQVFGTNNVSKDEISAVIRELADVGSARRLPDPESTGRPREIWVHIQHLPSFSLGKYGNDGKYAPVNSLISHESGEAA